jgi:hypothetical protein
MTDLWHSLLKSEYSYLKIVAEKWGFDFTAPDAREGIDLVVDSLLNPDLLAGIAELLDPEEQEVLVWLDEQGGKSPWDHITRRFGKVREVGAGHLERERPDLDPVSPLESLCYRALVARGFFDTETGPQEFAYLPDDLRELIMPRLNPDRTPTPVEKFICRVAAPRERVEEYTKPGFILDQLCSLVAGIRIGQDPTVHLPGLADPEEGFYQGLASTAGLLLSPDQTSPESIRDFLELEDPDGLMTLWKCWGSEEFPAEIHLLPTIEVEGDPPLEAHRVRNQLLSFLDDLAQDEWWSLESFLSQVKERHPDILRTGGDYDSWFIKRRDSDEYLTGFDHWDEIEGALIRFMVTGPMFWLGLIELGAPDEESPPLAFRLTAIFSEMREEKRPSLPERMPDLVQLRSQGEIRMTVDVPRKTRYQIARFCDWYPVKADAYQYRISPSSLGRAEGQGLMVPHLLSLLKNHTEAIPPNVLAALERFESSGTQAEIEPKTILRLGSPAILKALKKSRANRYIIEQLGPTVVIIRPGSEEKVAQVLMELGFFVQIADQDLSQT